MEWDYVQVHGHIKEFQGKRHAFAFSIRPVIDFNDISLHFIECIHVHLENHQTEGRCFKHYSDESGYECTFLKWSERIPGSMSQSSMDGSGNDICMSVLRIFLEPSTFAREHGLHVDEVFRRGGLPKNKNMDAINYLVDVGQIYSTIDEYHFKSASNGYQ